MTQLQRGFLNLDRLAWYWQREGAPGRPHVPARCQDLHRLYGAALAAQTGAAGAVAVGMAAGRLDQVTRQMEASGRTQRLLEESDRQVGSICAKYNLRQWFRIQVTPGSAGMPALLPR